MSDLRNIALTVEAGRALQEVNEKLGIDDLRAIIRLGFAYAIKHGMLPHHDSAIGPRRTNNYDTGGLDEDGTMEEAVKIYYSTDPLVEAEPYRAVEALMNKGLLLLAQDVQRGEIGTIGDLMIDSVPHQ